MYLVLDFGLPVELAQANPVISVTAKVNGTSLPTQKFVKSGRYQYVAMVPESALRIHPAKVEFELDRTFRASDGSERGLTALSVGLQHTNTAAFDRQAETARAREGFEYLLAKRALMIPNDKQTEMVKLFHQVPVWGHMFFQNVQIEKNPLDLWMMQQIIYEIQPDFVIETGTWKGGSALYFAHTLNGMGLERSKVITVDIQDTHQIASAHPLWKKYVTAFLGSSTDPDIVGKIAQLVKGKKTLITLDSDHSMGHVLKELNLYAPLVSSGSYLIVEDTYIDGVPTDPDFGPGPMAAVRKYLEEGGDKTLRTGRHARGLHHDVQPGRLAAEKVAGFDGGRIFGAPQCGQRSGRRDQTRHFGHWVCAKSSGIRVDAIDTLSPAIVSHPEVKYNPVPKCFMPGLAGRRSRQCRSGGSAAPGT